MATQVKVWDWGVRFFHWSIVLGFGVAWLSAEDESRWHHYSGYMIGGWLLFRLIWGIFGTPYARFSSFVFSPSETLRYARSLLSGKPLHYFGHNPLGALMVFALLSSLAGTVYTGLALQGDLPWIASAAENAPADHSASFERESEEDDDEDDREISSKEFAGESEQAGEHEHESAQHEWWEEWHEALAELSLLLIVLHLIGVIVAGVLHKENLVKAMINGYKQKSD